MSAKQPSLFDQPEPMAWPPMLVVDTETTGFDPVSDRIVEFAVVRVWPEGRVEGQGWLVNPGRPIPPEACEIHHLTDRHVAKAPALKTVLAKAALAYPPSGAIIVAHNAAFDAGFLPEPWTPRLCTLRLARRLLPDLPAHRNQYLRYALGLDVPEAEGDAAHRALSDTFVTARLLLRLLEEGRKRPELQAIFNDPERLIAWTEEPQLLKVCRFGKKHRDKLWSEVPQSYLKWMLAELKDLDLDTRFTLDTWLDRYAKGEAKPPKEG